MIRIYYFQHPRTIIHHQKRSSMKRTTFIVALATLFMLAATIIITTSATSQKRKASSGKFPKDSMIKRGEYLVTTSGCHDCHSPKIFTPMGPMPDTTRLLSGHPASDTIPAVPPGLIGATPKQWGAVTSNDFTAWVGLWGTSFTQNLTPDVETGIGSWTEDMFVAAIRRGKHMGVGRNLLPPMPWPAYRNMSDDYLKSIFTYLKSLPPISNAVPDPISPTGERIPTPKVLK